MNQPVIGYLMLQYANYDIKMFSSVDRINCIVYILPLYSYSNTAAEGTTVNIAPAKPIMSIFTEY